MRPAEVLGEEALRHLHPPGYGRGVQLRVRHEEIVQRAARLRRKESLVTEVFIQLRPVYPRPVGQVTGALVGGSAGQSRVVDKAFGGLASVRSAYPYGVVGQSDLFNV